jgi:hypothetical protein
MADSQFRPSSKAKTTRATGRATLIDRLSAADRARLEAIHADTLQLAAANKTDAAVSLRKVTGYLYEILQMSVIDNPLADEEDRSCEVPIHLSSARAIADMIFILGGSASDGSESRIEELEMSTLSNAMYSIMEHLDAAEEVQHELDERERLERVAKASVSH